MGGRSIYNYLGRREIQAEKIIEDINFDPIYSKLQCSQLLTHHVGCVNSLDWNDSGDLLVSGSDDCNVGLWSYSDGRLLCSISSGHAGNIFSVKFLPGSETNIVTASGDACVKLFSIHQDGSESNRSTWKCHHDRVKKIDVEPGNPYFFMTASEDGTIRQFDIREKQQCDHNPCRNVVASWEDDDISLNSLSISPLRPEYVACAGTGPIIRIFDRRRPFNHETPRQNSSSFTSNVWIPVQRNSDMVTSVKFSSFSSELAASLINDKIHLINYDNFIAGKYSSPIVQIETDAYNELQRKWDREKYDDYYFAISRLISSHRSLQYIVSKYLSSILCYEIYNRILAMAHLPDKMEEMLDDADYLVDHIFWEDDINILGIAFLVFAASEERQKLANLSTNRHDMFEKLQEYSSDHMRAFMAIKDTLPIQITQTRAWARIREQNHILTTSSMSYSGHLNVQTVKDLTFLGAHHEYLASGSDGGFFFIWNIERKKIIFIGRSDNHVVNAIATHPKLPILAVSGIDHDIKLWKPDGTSSELERQWSAIPKTHWNDLIEHLKGLDGATIMVSCPVQ